MGRYQDWHGTYAQIFWNENNTVYISSISNNLMNSKLFKKERINTKPKVYY